MLLARVYLCPHWHNETAALTTATAAAAYCNSGSILYAARLVVIEMEHVIRTYGS